MPRRSLGPKGGQEARPVHQVGSGNAADLHEWGRDTDLLTGAPQLLRRLGVAINQFLRDADYDLEPVSILEVSPGWVALGGFWSVAGGQTHARFVPVQSAPPAPQKRQGSGSGSLPSPLGRIPG